MALITLKDAEVFRVNNVGFGVKVFEKNEYQGKSYKTYYTVWFKQPHGLQEGDVVSVSGFYSDKIGEPWTDKETGLERVSIERSLNSPRLNGDAPVQRSADVVDEPWVSELPAVADDDAPF